MTRLNGQICPRNAQILLQEMSYIDIYLNRHWIFEVHNQARWETTSYRSDCFAGDEITLSVYIAECQIKCPKPNKRMCFDVGWQIMIFLLLKAASVMR